MCRRHLYLINLSRVLPFSKNTKEYDHIFHQMG